MLTDGQTHITKIIGSFCNSYLEVAKSQVYESIKIHDGNAMYYYTVSG